MKALTLVFAAALLVSPGTSLLAQEAKENKESKDTKPSLAALAEAAEVRLDKAIALALKAREGIAVGVELESKVVGDKPLPVFEVMVCGKDGAVYEVFVNGVDGSIVSKDQCKDEEDVGEVKALVQQVEGAASLRDIVAESRAVLRGTCVAAVLVAKDKQARVVLLNRGHRLAARFGLKDGQLTGVAWLDAKKAKKAGDDDDDDDDDDDEGEEHEGGEHAATNGNGGVNGKNGKNEEHEEHEGHQKREGSSETGERAKKGSSEKLKQDAEKGPRQF